jgi:ABC-type polysaccharide transport system permease subunit
VEVEATLITLLEIIMDHSTLIGVSVTTAILMAVAMVDPMDGEAAMMTGATRMTGMKKSRMTITRA